MSKISCNELIDHSWSGFRTWDSWSYLIYLGERISYGFLFGLEDSPLILITLLLECCREDWRWSYLRGMVKRPPEVELGVAGSCSALIWRWAQGRRVGGGSHPLQTDNSDPTGWHWANEDKTAVDGTDEETITTVEKTNFWAVYRFWIKQGFFSVEK